MSSIKLSWSGPRGMILYLLSFCLVSTAGAAERRVEDGVFISDAMPQLRIRVDPRFEYIGASSFILKEVANVERHHWVTTEGDIVTAMIVLQFEGLREGVAGSYAFDIPDAEQIAGSNYRYAPERIELGGLQFVHNTWAWDNGQSIHDNPDSEAAHTAKLLAEHGYSLDNELIMARFVTEVGPEKRDELIVFYIEPLGVHGKTLEDFPNGGPPSSGYDALSGLIKRRAFQAISWTEGTP